MGIALDNGAVQNTVGPANYIAGNARQGVYLSEAQASIGPGNIITNNYRHGIYVNVYRSKAVITQNSIFNNTMLGIEYSSTIIPVPVIISATTGATVSISGTACPGCTVELFESEDNSGEGQSYLGSATAAPGGGFILVVSGIHKPYLTATATDAVKGTSKFSAVFTANIGLKVYLPLILK
jgi:hypothetical protein